MNLHRRLKWLEFFWPNALPKELDRLLGTITDEELEAVKRGEPPTPTGAAVLAKVRAMPGVMEVVALRANRKSVKEMTDAELLVVIAAGLE